MKTYMIRVIFTKGNFIFRTVKAADFNKAVKLAKNQYATWLRKGHDVQIFNPGENHNLPQSQYVGQE